MTDQIGTHSVPYRIAVGAGLFTVLLAAAVRGEMAQVAADSGHHTHRRLARHHDRPLLDVQLEPARDRLRIDLRHDQRHVRLHTEV